VRVAAPKVFGSPPGPYEEFPADDDAEERRTTDFLVRLDTETRLEVLRRIAHLNG
jgi:hypothetical protein